MKRDITPSLNLNALNYPLSVSLHLVQNIPKMVQSRLSELSKTKRIFQEEIKPYETALCQAGHNEKLEYTNQYTFTSTSKKRNRHRNVIWYNPPFNKEVSTNLAAKFLRLIDKHFPKDSPLHRHFNRSTIKVSYSCLPNINNIIANHNKKVLKSQSNSSEENKKCCNCRAGPNSCPLNGKCLSTSIIYKATVQSEAPQNPNNSQKSNYAEYIGQASNTFKERFNNHQLSFNHEKYESNTGLSKHIWNLKRNKIKFKVTWSILAAAPTYRPSTGICMLCSLEKTFILRSEHPCPLNKKSELMRKCRHREKFLLSSW